MGHLDSSANLDLVLLCLSDCELGCNAFLATWFATLTEKTSKSWCGACCISVIGVPSSSYSLFLEELQLLDMNFIA